MKRTLSHWALLGFFWTVGIGTLLHFTYVWSGRSPWAAAFSAVNESTWEHMKLFYLPWFIFSLLETAVFRRSFPMLPWARALGAALGLLLIPTLFYTLSGAVGTLPSLVNILIFIAAASAACVYSFRWIGRSHGQSMFLRWSGILLLCLLLFLFVFFTFQPPHLPLFLDPITLCYGIP